MHNTPLHGAWGRCVSVLCGSDDIVDINTFLADTERVRDSEVSQSFLRASVCDRTLAHLTPIQRYQIYQLCAGRKYRDVDAVKASYGFSRFYFDHINSIVPFDSNVRQLTSDLFTV